MDDDAAHRMLYRLSLRLNQGGIFDTIEAAAGQAGIDAFKKHRPDCIVLDYSLPDMDGLEFMSVLQQEFGALPCAIVMLTGVQDERIAVRAMKSGATDYIPKTERMGELLEQSIVGAIDKFRMRQQIEEQRIALETSERTYRALMEGSPQLVWVADTEGVILYCNTRWSEYTGLSPHSTKRFSVMEGLSQEDRNPYAGAWSQASSANTGFEVEGRLRRASDGACRWHLIRVVPIKDFPSEGAQWLGTCTDIENNKQAEKVIQQTQKWESIGLLAGGIAHDFNNLLVGILGGASYIASLLPATHPGQPVVSGIIRSGERAAQLTRQMLTYSGTGTFFVAPVNLSVAVRETCELVHGSIPPNVHLVLNVADSLPLIEADPGQIQQVIVNLVMNAFEAIPEGESGIVTVKTFTQNRDSGLLPEECGALIQQNYDRYVVLEVKDTGIGMNREMLARIFDPFFTTKFTGRGLGLAAAEGIVRSGKGCITVKSEPGRGSTFCVFLPATD